jgi:osmotically-inducible protein OsmY
MVNIVDVVTIHENAGQIRDEVLQAIAAEPALKVYANRPVWPLRVIVKETIVILEGMVDSDAAATQADIAADSVPAVSKVISHLRVAPSETSTPQSMNQQITEGQSTARHE